MEIIKKNSPILRGSYFLCVWYNHFDDREGKSSQTFLKARLEFAHFSIFCASWVINWAEERGVRWWLWTPDGCFGWLVHFVWSQFVSCHDILVLRATRFGYKFDPPSLSPKLRCRAPNALFYFQVSRERLWHWNIWHISIQYPRVALHIILILCNILL